ncbi:hypothetical protein Y032_0611g646 [Ancylostoma ceylanicum]|uniref:Pre-SET domain-containing protein n=1 Tax=Ancylostoma ceylanicum TaxID=53326 RepID=A0A016WKZ6_9BILA|nr:hypothetical protein Y032_0611g646 [Ancylostoma ceylanicum]
MQACAATLLYRKRRNARLLPSTSDLTELMKENQISRLRQMIRQLIPESGLRSGKGYESIADPNLYNEFIYHPFRDSSKRRYRLHRDISNGLEVFPVSVYSDTGNCIKPDPFEYISANDYTMFRESSLMKQEKHLFTVKCDCSDLICGDGCACRHMNDQFTPCTIMVSKL